MTNDEFQKIVLEELRSLKEGQREIKEEQREIRSELKAINVQTADLTEFREQTNAKFNTIIEENDILKELMGKHEVDIRRLKRKIVQGTLVP